MTHRSVPLQLEREPADPPYRSPSQLAVAATHDSDREADIWA